MVRTFEKAWKVLKVDTHPGRIGAEQDMQDKTLLYRALSRLYAEPESSEAREEAYNALSIVSMDFRNDMVSHGWNDTGDPDAPQRVSLDGE